nr:unnamed protein product [Callosobruchus chinensis]CAH7724229.1 unnamed protein product [Callosobruchus chinensis]CAH7725575.1 unnamed protein product [Callosobruchus chinensis]CAH7730118.1 unnamed protein product [Callosobruchus chinensis]CAH7734225.1 unnamed protein product [Callosobruchus chinensis]
MYSKVEIQEGRTLLSTKHSHETVIVHKRTGDVENPVAVIEYSKAKSSIDLSDQMASYASALRKTCLLFRDNDESNLPSTSKPDTRQDRHVLKEKEGCSHKVRRYCKGCYNKKLQSEIPKNKVTKVTTYTDSCKMNPYFCLDCFGKYHK